MLLLWEMLEKIMHLPPCYHSDPIAITIGLGPRFVFIRKDSVMFRLLLYPSLSFILTPGHTPSPSVHLKHCSVFLHIIFSLLQSSLSNAVTGYAHVSTPALCSKINTLHWAHIKVSMYLYTLTTFCFSLPSIQAHCTLNALVGL